MPGSSPAPGVRSLERQIGRPLFERRRGTTASLTEDGRRAYAHAVALLAQIDGFVESFSSPRERRPRRRLVIAAPNYVSFRLALEAAAPAGSTLIWRERLGLYAGRDHPLAGRRQVSPAELSAYPFIYLPKKYALRAVIEAALAKCGIAGNPSALQTDNPVLARRTLMQGKAIGCLFDHTVRDNVEQGDLIELPLATAAPAVEVRLVASKGVLAQHAARELIELAERSRAESFNLG